MRVAVVCRGKWGKRAYDTLKRLDVACVDMVELHAPRSLESPHVPPISADVVFSYALSPELNLEVVRRAAEGGAQAVVVAGGYRYIPFSDARKVASAHGMELLVHEICCSLTPEHTKSPALREVLRHVGFPVLKVSIAHGRVEHVEVVRGAPCGSTWFMAEGLRGVEVGRAPTEASLLVSYYPCRARRGGRGGIHSSCELHLEAMKRAIEDCR